MMLVLSSLLVACSQPMGTSVSATPADGQVVNLLISAAASLTDVIEELEQRYEQQNPAVEITVNFGSSGSLQQQIEQGAPVDVFISAAVDKMNALQARGLLLDDTRQDLLHNQVVLVVSLRRSLSPSSKYR
ncbi:MAG: molybdate ABC transporter substrate-binding protein, partial [Cyanothece sp. SIO1E1]|nr:molybdate ABC transporter substrate-binding protein [Cyanothece sp. SIO1E1]